jgi:hypothetical protein
LHMSGKSGVMLIVPVLFLQFSLVFTSKGLFIWEEVIPVIEKTFRLAK